MEISEIFPISADSLPLPTGAATSALQTAGNASLASIDGKLNSLGQKTLANSVPVAIASDQTAFPVSQSGSWSTGRTWTLSSGTDSVASVQSGTWVLGANSGVDIGDVTVNNASGASAVNIQDGGNSITVDGTVAATQSGTWVLGANSGVDIGDVTINNASGASAVNIQDGGNSITVDGTVAATQSGTWNVTNVSGTVTLPTGAATSALQTTGNVSLSTIATATTDAASDLGLLHQKEGTPPIVTDFIAVGAARLDSVTGIGDFELGTLRMTSQRGLHCHAVDASGNTISQSTSAPEHSMNGAFSKAQAIGGQLDDTSTTAATENNVAPVRITAQRAIHANLRNASGTEIGTNASPAYVRHTDGTNNMPAGDAGARGIFTKIYDGSAFFNVPVTVVNAGGFGAMATAVANPNTLATALVTATGELPGVVASTDNTLANAKYLQVDSVRSLATYNAGSTRASYSAIVQGLAPAATATDIFNIKGSGTKTVKITQLSISGTAATAISPSVQLIVRSTANSGGTSSTPTIVKHDSNNAAATAVVTAYTANPTLGTTVGAIRSRKVAFPLTGTIGTDGGWDFGVRPSQPIVLRGTAESVSVNLSSATVVTGSIDIWVEFTEE